MTTGSNPADEYTATRAEYARWLMDPEKRGTQQQWAADHKVSEFTVSRWRHHPEVLGLLAAWRTNLTPEFAKIVANMIRLAMGTGPQAVAAAKLCADVMGMNAPTKLDVSGKMTMADFLSKATFAETHALDA